MINETEQKTLYDLIDSSEVVSFDIFDTLIKRVVNEPEEVFDLVGQKFGIADFRKIRENGQMKASMKAEKEGLPHANYDQIYEYLSEEGDTSFDWNAIKAYELELEGRVLRSNTEVHRVYEYAKSKGKRIIAVSDMYLQRKHILPVLERCGYGDMDEVYVSADDMHTKFRGDIFDYVREKEGVDAGKIVHIGDSKEADYTNSQAAGWNAFLYRTNKLGDEKKQLLHSPIDFGIPEYLENGNFWHDLGLYAGGPLYYGIFDWFSSKIKNNDHKIFFLSRDGYNLYNLMKDDLGDRAEYLYASRRSMVFAGTSAVDEEALKLLPPYTFGQTCGELVEYYELPKVFGENITEAGFASLSDRIETVEDIDKFKKLYGIYEKEFLLKCEEERKELEIYFNKLNVFEDNIIVFDCGWNGSSQFLLDRVIKACGKNTKAEFCYIGILDSAKSKNQLYGKKYETFLFDHSSNYSVQTEVKQAVAVFELFFGAPHESVIKYKDGEPILENNESDNSFKKDIDEGICDFVGCAREYADIDGIQYDPEIALASVVRLIEKPTEEEAVIVGNVENVDGFAKQSDKKKYIAFLTEEDYKENKNIEIYWPQGFLKRQDIDETFKQKVSADRNYGYETEKEAEISEEAEPVYSYYDYWTERAERKRPQRELSYKPSFSVVIPVYNVTDDQLTECIDSILDQTYDNWELILVDDHSSWESVRTILRRYESDKRITVIYRTENGNISKATNDGIEKASGDFIAFCDCDDTIAPNALYEMALKLNENKKYDFIYSDEDKLSEDGKHRHSPFFKPDWSPDAFMSLMYTNHLAVYRTELVKKTGGLRTEFNGAQDYDFTLRFMELSDNKRVGHVQKVLYHWRERKESIASKMEAKPYALKVMRKLKEEALVRRNLTGEVKFVSDMYQYRVVYKNTDNPLVSIVIPSKDNFGILKQCIDSVKSYTDYPNYEIVVVDNGSSDTNRKKIEEYLGEMGAEYIYEKMDFNFSKMCNIGAAAAKGEYILFLNDDIEVFQHDWLDIMVGQASLAHTGAVGVKLLYPKSDIIQHIGITNLRIGPSHNEMRCSDSSIYYFGRNRMNYNYLAVTAACLMVSREKYLQVEGFDEELTVAYNDVDFCFKLYEKGYYNVMRNDVILYHHESFSRGSDEISDQKRIRLFKEKSRLNSKHPKLVGRDPFYNGNLADNKGDYSIRILDGYSDAVNVDNIKKYQKYDSSIKLSVDTITDGDEITVKGWIVASTTNDSSFYRYMILESETGEAFRIKLNRVVRTDVDDAFGISEHMYGFEITFPDRILNRFRTSYRIGIFICSKSGLVRKFMRTDAVIARKRSRICYPLDKTPDIESMGSVKGRITVDELTQENGELTIRGWLNEHKKKLNYCDKILVAEKGNEKIYYKLNDEFRSDVALVYDMEPFMSCAGFSGCMYLEEGYSVKGIILCDHKRNDYTFYEI